MENDVLDVIDRKARRSFGHAPRHAGGPLQVGCATSRIERPAYDLVRARRDGRLGEGLKPPKLDCTEIEAARKAGAEAAPMPRRTDLSAPPPPCGLRLSGLSCPRQPVPATEGPPPPSTCPSKLILLSDRSRIPL